MQEEAEGRNVSKVTICFSKETLGDKDLPLDEDTSCEFISHSEEVFVHAGMADFYRRLVAGVAVNATHESGILTVNREKKRGISLALSSKDRKYRANRISA